MMGLNKALKARESGADVLVFFDTHATFLALKSTNITFADFAPSQQIIADLIAKGADVYVCPHCLMVNGSSFDDVQPGIKQLEATTLSTFANNSSVVTLDY